MRIVRFLSIRSFERMGTRFGNEEISVHGNQIIDFSKI